MGVLCGPGAGEETQAEHELACRGTMRISPAADAIAQLTFAQLISSQKSFDNLHIMCLLLMLSPHDLLRQNRPWPAGA